ncbi:NAD(P)-dependent oxidoreductase [Oleispirillum naphthae]|uniref:NAD(P)-dependent oxidoreductase n=1 Tax=Oleispirillum naphthae TaxID=2838853 RepID=UPI0030825E3B
MRAFVTAQLNHASIAALGQYMDMAFGGWGHTGVKLAPAELIAQAGNPEVLIVCYEHVDAEVISRLTRLKVICCSRGGVRASVDVDAATRAGIPVLYTPGRNAGAVADIALGLMLAAARNIALTNHYIRMRDWENATWDMDGNTAEKRFSGPELEDKTIGIVGFGEVGRKIALRANGFGMRILTHDPFFTPFAALPGVQSVSLDDLMRQADFVVMACALNDKTHGMIDAGRIALMKPGSYFVNVARGALVDEAALHAALRDGAIAGAGLDVLIDEPIPHDHPFLSLPNIVITPHIGGASADITERQSKILGTGLIAFLQNRQPSNIINPEVLHHDQAGNLTPRH